MHKQDIKDKLNTFIQPFKPLGEAIVIFAKTTTGKSIGVVVLAITIISVSAHILYEVKCQSNRYPMIQQQMRLGRSNLGHRFEREISENQDQFENMRENIENHRREMMQAMTMTDRDISKAMKQTKTAIAQNITKLSINNTVQNGYSLSISGNMIQGTLIGNPHTKLSEQLQYLKGTLSGSMFSVPYTIENLQKIVEVLDER